MATVVDASSSFIFFRSSLYSQGQPVSYPVGQQQHQQQQQHNFVYQQTQFLSQSMDTADHHHGHHGHHGLNSSHHSQQGRNGGTPRGGGGGGGGERNRRNSADEKRNSYANQSFRNAIQQPQTQGGQQQQMGVGHGKVPPQVPPKPSSRSASRERKEQMEDSTEHLETELNNILRGQAGKEHGGMANGTGMMGHGDGGIIAEQGRDNWGGKVEFLVAA